MFAIVSPLSHLFNLFDIFGHLGRYLAHQAWAQALVPHLHYAVGCWIFFVTTAFLAAILRSPEGLRVLVTAAQGRRIWREILGGLRIPARFAPPFAVC